MDVIQVDGLVKRYGSLTAVDGVSFSVRRGEVFGFLGPNGAGKTTTISILCTLLRPTEGRVLVNGFDVLRQPDQVRRSIGLIFQDSTLDIQLTALENLEFHAFLYNVQPQEARAREEKLLRMVELWERRNDLVKTFSGGMKRRLEIARGLLHQPTVLFLDEPTLGLDPQTRRRIWDYILDLRQREDLTIFLTTHYMDEAEHCDRIGIIDHGKIVALDTPSRLKSLVGGDIVVVRAADADRAAGTLRQRFGLLVEITDGTVRLQVPRGDEFVPELVRALGSDIAAISVSRPTLDDVFLKLTGRAIRDEEAGTRDEMRLRSRMWGGGRR